MKNLTLILTLFLLPFLGNSQDVVNESLEFNIPFDNAEQEADFIALGGDRIDMPAPGSYTLVRSTPSASSVRDGIDTRDSGDGLPLLLDCTVVPDTDLNCRADLPPVDFVFFHENAIVNSFGTWLPNNEGDLDLNALTIIPGNSGCVGDPVTITRTYTATDEVDPNGVATAECIQVFTIENTIPPTITAPADATVFNAAAATLAPANLGTGVGGPSNCTNHAPVVVTFMDVSDQMGATDPMYTITRTWTATDDCGLTSTADQIITVDVSLTIPTMGEWGIMILALFLIIFSVVVIRRRQTSTQLG